MGNLTGKTDRNNQLVTYAYQAICGNNGPCVQGFSPSRIPVMAVLREEVPGAIVRTGNRCRRWTASLNGPTAASEEPPSCFTWLYLLAGVRHMGLKGR